MEFSAWPEGPRKYKAVSQAYSVQSPCRGLSSGQLSRDPGSLIATMVLACFSEIRKTVATGKHLKTPPAASCWLHRHWEEAARAGGLSLLPQEQKAPGLALLRVDRDVLPPSAFPGCLTACHSCLQKSAIVYGKEEQITHTRQVKRNQRLGWQRGIQAGGRKLLRPGHRCGNRALQFEVMGL